MCEICSELTTEIPKRRYWRRSGVLIVNFEQILQIAVLFPLLPQNYEQINSNWELINS